MLKGLLAALFPRIATGAGIGALPPELLAPTLAAGIAAVLGHVFSPWLRFHGGRGVATSLGVFAGVMPLPTLAAFAMWAILLLFSRRVSVGSIGAALAYPFLVLWLSPRGFSRGTLVIFAALISVLIVLRHLPNIRRILAGTEPPFLGTRKEGRP